ncbi:hypothetical protein AVEN_85816-1 [Araneus ventricosus]|uniref:Uncharacterized protein n=1 Tax=Araneus ventricosus TaxID=182803 RepID=A0A4Y2U2R4_ARAVE|nr:hypothetical protein AVEN_85816-1 [Araneus ventricosus]
MAFRALMKRYLFENGKDLKIPSELNFSIIGQLMENDKVTRSHRKTDEYSGGYTASKIVCQAHTTLEPVSEKREKKQSTDEAATEDSIQQTLTNFIRESFRISNFKEISG